jgi:hypothetical protein
MATMPEPTTDQAVRAAREVLNTRVREGLISRQLANEILRTGLPLTLKAIADARRHGWPTERANAYFEGKVTDAKARQAAARTRFARQAATATVVAAEVSRAAWAGLQADCARYTDRLQAAPVR